LHKSWMLETMLTQQLAGSVVAEVDCRVGTWSESGHLASRFLRSCEGV
jgi:hypothetical protein